MAGGGNGQAKESAALQTSQNNQSERYRMSGEKFGSPEYLSTLRSKDESNCGCNSSVSRTFGKSMSGADSYSALQAERDLILQGDRERRAQINKSNWERFTGMSSGKGSENRDAGAKSGIDTAIAAMNANKPNNQFGYSPAQREIFGSNSSLPSGMSVRDSLAARQKNGFEQARLFDAVNASGLSNDQVVGAINKASYEEALARAALNSGQSLSRAK
jgi:hypothetical protein